MRITVALAFEVDVVSVFQPSKRLSARTVQPRVVVFGEQRPRLSGRRIERQNPAILVVRRANNHNGFRALLIPNRSLHLDFAILEPRIDPLRFSRGDIEDRGSQPILRVAYVVPAGNLFRVARFVDIARNVVGFRTIPCFVDERDHTLLVGTKIQSRDRLARLQLKRFARVFSLPPGFVFFPKFRPFADGFDQLALLLLEKFLALGSALLGGSGGRYRGGPAP